MKIMKDFGVAVDTIKPVAWLRKYGDGTWFADTQDHSKTEVCIPLYTTPQYRELSDEEIEKIAITCFDMDYGSMCLDSIKFAREIIKDSKGEK